MKVLVTGAGGMLAHAVIPELRRLGMEVVGLTQTDLDVSDWTAVKTVVAGARPDVVIQGAAYTAVDAAETEEQTATLINATAAGYVAEACQRVGALFVYPSTDYVFDGEANRPYRPEDPVAPVSAYGRSKAAGEREAAKARRNLIVRTSWLYGLGGRNFVTTILNLASERYSLRVVDDQRGLPTWTASLARTIGRLLKAEAVGTFHAADSGQDVSWYEFAKEILAESGLHARLFAVSTETYGARAPRPRFSALDCSLTEQVVGDRMALREHSLVEYLQSLKTC